MKILVTGACGFVGSVVATELAARLDGATIYGLDNFSRPGSHINRKVLSDRGISLLYGDIRSAADLEAIPEVDWVIDAAANPSVMAGVDGQTSSRQVVEHNLVGTINTLEFCKRVGAGLVLLSTSRVYSIPGLASLLTGVVEGAFQPSPDQTMPPGISARGVTEQYSCAPPVSLYGATKLASETLALEYGEAFGLPVWVNRCGVLAGAGQFGRPDQGIFSYWIHSWCQRRDLGYIGFDGKGHQVRDCLHPDDLTDLIVRQIDAPDADAPRVVNVSGGVESAYSLRQLSAWCEERFGEHQVGTQPVARPFDLPWVVLDSSVAQRAWDWLPRRTAETIFAEIATHAEQHPEWLDLSAPL